MQYFFYPNKIFMKLKIISIIAIMSCVMAISAKEYPFGTKILKAEQIYPVLVILVNKNLWGFEFKAP